MPVGNAAKLEGKTRLIYFFWCYLHLPVWDLHGKDACEKKVPKKKNGPKMVVLWLWWILLVVKSVKTNFKKSKLYGFEGRKWEMWKKKHVEKQIIELCCLEPLQVDWAPTKLNSWILVRSYTFHVGFLNLLPRNIVVLLQMVCCSKQKL